MAALIGGACTVSLAQSKIVRMCSHLFLIALVIGLLSSEIITPVWNIGGGSSDAKDKESIIYQSCLEETLLSLPIGKGAKNSRNHSPDHQLMVWAHHYDAGNWDKWNAEKMFKLEIKELKNSSRCHVWEVGAHTEAMESRELMKAYPECEYHAYEPIPDFFATLSKHWEGTANMHTHNYGLASEDGEIRVSSSVLKGQSTYIGDGDSAINCGAHYASKCAGCPQGHGEAWCNGQCIWKEGQCTESEAANFTRIITANIKSFDFAVKEAGSKPTLLHMNCEGCEWDLLPQALESGFISDIPVIQVGFHNYGQVGLGKRVLEYCDIRQKMSQTHRLVDGAVPFAWERWVLK